MKSILLNKISASQQQSFNIRPKIYPQAYSLWHHHKEYEVLYFVKNSGTAYVGDKTIPYKGGTLLLLSANLPHMFVPKLNSEEHPDNVIDAYVLHFSYEMINAMIENIPEFKSINNLFNNWKRGMVFNNIKNNKEVFKLMQEINEGSNYKRITLFFELLNLLEMDKSFDFIASAGFVSATSLPKGRLEKVYDFTILNFNDSSISLDNVAESINMNKAAFCRYFKKITHKTYFQFLNEIRIGNACKILIEEDKSITDVAFLSGFNNMSNFNRQFKLIMGQSPSSFLKLRELQR
jgi:AraC-like DNA-binding protein